MEFRRALLPFFFPAVWPSFPSIKLEGRRPSSSNFSKMSIAAWYPFFSNSSNLLNWSVPYYSKMSDRYKDLWIRMLNYLLHRHLNIETILGYFGLLQGIDTWYTRTMSCDQFNVEGMQEKIYYARRLWISVMAGTCLAFENGFHLLIRSHHPDTVSPKFLGELSSTYLKN